MVSSGFLDRCCVICWCNSKVDTALGWIITKVGGARIAQVNTVDKTLAETSTRYQLETDVRLTGDLGLILRGIYHGGLATHLGKH